MNLRNIYYIALTSALLCLSNINLKAQELVRPVITGAPFLQMVPDARSGGMGEVGVATLGDNYAQFHNPAKYLFLPETHQGIGLSYIPQFKGYANDIFLGSATYFRNLNQRSAIGGSITYFSYGNVELEEEIGNEIVSQGSFVPHEFALDLAYSLKLSEKFGMSLAGRYIRSSLTDDQMNSEGHLKNAQAIAADISGFYSSSPINYQNKWTIGFSLKNIGSRLEYSNEAGYEYPIPTSLEIGGGYHLVVSENNMLSFYGEVLKYLVPASDDEGNLPDKSAIGGVFSSFTDAPGGFSEEMKEVITSFGSEFSIDNKFQLRAGYFFQSAEKGASNHLTAGAGVNWNGFVFDLAYQKPVAEKASSIQGDDLRFSLSYRFGARDDETPVANSYSAVTGK